MTRTAAGLLRTIPALPARDVARSVALYAEAFGFEAVHVDSGFAVLARDDAIVHLWESGDESWRGRPDLAQRPVRSGAESFLAGTASCRIEVENVDALYAELATAGVLHPVCAKGRATRTSAPASSPPSTSTATCSSSSAGSSSGRRPQTPARSAR